MPQFKEPSERRSESVALQSSASPVSNDFFTTCLATPVKRFVLFPDRLQTVMDFDRVLVLADGEILEYDTPSTLLRDGEDGSEFARLCRETGDFERLKSLVKT